MESVKGLRRVKKQTGVNLDPDVLEAGRKFARERGISFSSLVQRALLHYLEHWREVERELQKESEAGEEDRG